MCAGFATGIGAVDEARWRHRTVAEHNHRNAVPVVQRDLELQQIVTLGSLGKRTDLRLYSGGRRAAGER